jgi:predicted PurR-regulated permease PerM
MRVLAGALERRPIEFALDFSVNGGRPPFPNHVQFTPTQKRAAAWAALAAVAVVVLRALGPVLTPFLIASVLAYALTPLVDRLDNLWGGRMPRLLAVVIVELVAIVALLGVVLLMVPVLLKEIPLMREQLPLLFDRLNATLAPWLAQFGLSVSLDLASLRENLAAYLQTNWSDSFGSVWSSLKIGGSLAVALVGNALLVPVALFYLLLDWKPLVARVMQLVPPRVRPGVDSFTGEADAVLGQYLRGQLLVMVTMALFYSAGLALFGLDLALPIGVFTGLAMFVPYVGFGIGAILAILAGLLEFAPAKAFAMVGVVYGLGQLVEGFYLTPRLVGERIGLHPLAVIFALLAFGQVLGFVGVLIALPASAVLLVAIRRARSGYFSSRLYLG